MAWLRVRLDGIPETALWTLYHRAMDAGRADSELRDPKAIELLNSIDFPFRERFGPDLAGLNQVLGQRARTFDAELNTVLARNPDAQVVVLGEGLETQFWRVDNGHVRWFSVDLPAIAAIRASLLGDDPPRRRSWAGSALNDTWVTELGARAGDRVVVVAQGLLMYLEPTDVEDLITRCAQWFPGGTMLFDVVPRWFSKLSERGVLVSPGGYVPPRMPWGADGGTHARLRALHPNITDVRSLTPPAAGGPLAGFVLPLGRRLPLARRLLPEVIRVDFGP